MNHIDSLGLVFVTESKSNRLIESGEDKVQVREYLACHRDGFKELREPSTEYRFAHEDVSEIKGGPMVKFVFFKKVLADDVMCSYKRRWDTEVYYRDCKQCLGMGEYQVRSIDVRVLLPLVNLAYTLLKGIASSGLFQHVFNGARSIGAMCEALKRFAAIDLRKAWRGSG